MNMMKIITLSCALKSAFSQSSLFNQSVYQDSFQQSYQELLRHKQLPEKGLDGNSAYIIRDVPSERFDFVADTARIRYQSFDNTLEQLLKMSGFNETSSRNIIDYAKTIPSSATKYPILWSERINHYEKDILRTVWDNLRIDAASWINKNDPSLKNTIPIHVLKTGSRASNLSQLENVPQPFHKAKSKKMKMKYHNESIYLKEKFNKIKKTDKPHDSSFIRH